MSVPGVSKSAAAVMLGLDLAADDPRLAPLVPDESRRLARLVAQRDRILGGPVALLARRRLGRRLLRALYGRLNPGILTHYVARKRWLEAVVANAERDGIRTILVLAAGLDPMGWRLATRNTELEIVEIDLGETQRYKRELLRELGPLPANLRFVALDLADAGWQAQLAALLPDAARRGVCAIAEGLTMYLEPPAVERLFAGLAAFAVDARIGFTFLDATSPNPEAGRRARSWLRRRGERVHWTIPASRVEGWLGERGYLMVECRSAAELASHHLPGSRLDPALAAQPEFACLARHRSADVP
jgi:methyltransferase (TIGR00027 family)